MGESHRRRRGRHMNLAPHARIVKQAADAILAFAAWHTAGRVDEQPAPAMDLLWDYADGDLILWGALCDAACAEAVARGYVPPEFLRKGKADRVYVPKRSQKRRRARVARASAGRASARKATRSSSRDSGPGCGR